MSKNLMRASPRLNRLAVISLQTGSVLEGKNANVSKASILSMLPPVCELNGVFPENGVFPTAGERGRY